MEGRAIARPNELLTLTDHPGDLASMEGRAIARPNRGAGAGRPDRPLLLQWRAGQLPGQTWASMATVTGWVWLQWRAGQLPGQTPCPGTKVAVLTQASMEGRAIARPNSGVRWPGRRPQRGFNGGPGNCPAKRSTCRSVALVVRSFNGGPGNCPAKRTRPARSVRVPYGFNGGPGNCPAKPEICGKPAVALKRGFNGGPGNCPAKLSDSEGGGDI